MPPVVKNVPLSEEQIYQLYLLTSSPTLYSNSAEEFAVLLALFYHQCERPGEAFDDTGISSDLYHLDLGERKVKRILAKLVQYGILLAPGENTDYSMQPIWEELFQLEADKESIREETLQLIRSWPPRRRESAHE